MRKFTRKPKKEELPQEQMVLVPEEYKAPQMSKEELYRQYFLYWKSWQDELVESLLAQKSNKKQLDCALEALKNLDGLRGLLGAEAQGKLDACIARMRALKDSIAQDIYGNNSSKHMRDAERLRRDILRDFSFNKQKNSL